ncbi:hypothetical protein RUM43_009288 [Polyplax serrata]|uniref:Uncharacterized protein n=1 Tax=Polyplax serrata TaxID=468196 RepID=A0AAN8NZG1_POLSC
MERKTQKQEIASKKGTKKVMREQMKQKKGYTIQTKTKNSLKTERERERERERDNATTPEVQTTQKQIQETKTQVLAKQQKRERERENGSPTNPGKGTEETLHEHNTKRTEKKTQTHKRGTEIGKHEKPESEIAIYKMCQTIKKHRRPERGKDLPVRPRSQETRQSQTRSPRIYGAGRKRDLGKREKKIKKGRGTWRKDEEELKPEQMTGNDDEGGTTDEHKQIRLGEELCRRVQT